MAKYTIKFKVEAYQTDAKNLEFELQDLLKTIVLPALSAELTPLTLEVKTSRN